MLIRDIIIGSKISKLTVKDLYYKNGIKVAKCDCDCGNQTEVRVGNLASGRTKSCGCLRSQVISNRNYDIWENEPSNDRIGEVHGWLTVTRRDYSSPNKSSIYWICRCQCGRDIRVASFQFTRRSGIMSCRACYPKFMKEGIKMKMRTLHFCENPIRFVKDESGIWIVVDDFRHCAKLNVNLIDKVRRDLGEDHISQKPVLAKSGLADCFSDVAILHLINLMPVASGNPFRKWFKKIAIPSMSAPTPKPKVK